MLLRTAYASGIRYLDTANAYGTEPAIAKFFKAVPEAKKDTFIVTKDTPKSPKQMIEQLDQNLARLELDSVDMFFFHGLGDHHDTDTCLEFLKGKEFRETADAIKKSGKAKFVGFSCHNKDLALMLDHGGRGQRGRRDHGQVQRLRPQGPPVQQGPRRLPRQGHRPDLDEAARRLAEMLRRDASGLPDKQLAAIAEKLPAFKEKGLAPYQMLLHAIWTDERISSCCVSLEER